MAAPSVWTKLLSAAPVEEVEVADSAADEVVDTLVAEDMVGGATVEVEEVMAVEADMIAPEVEVDMTAQAEADTEVNRVIAVAEATTRVVEAEAAGSPPSIEPPPCATYRDDVNDCYDISRAATRRQDILRRFG
ncbi:MAG: hypothetical protein Q9222_003427 [Ikaeria aurantiellina]